MKFFRLIRSIQIFLRFFFRTLRGIRKSFFPSPGRFEQPTAQQPTWWQLDVVSESKTLDIHPADTKIQAPTSGRQRSMQPVDARPKVALARPQRGGPQLMADGSGEPKPPGLGQAWPIKGGGRENFPEEERDFSRG